MDMNEYNDGIRKADDVVENDGPRYADGEYLVAITEHEEKNKEPIPNTDPLRFAQVGLMVTFRILTGKFQGKEYKEYFNLKHPTSRICTKYGLAGLKRIYQALNFMPAQFCDIYGKRFVMQLESKEQPNNIDYPWGTKIIKCRAAKQPQGQKMDQSTNPEGNVDNLQNNALADMDLKSDPAAVDPNPSDKWKAQQEIDEIPF